MTDKPYDRDDDHDRPPSLDGMLLDLPEMHVVKIVPNDPVDHEFSYVYLVAPDDLGADPSVIIAEAEWANALMEATRDNPVFNFQNIPDTVVVPMLWHPGDAMETSGLTYDEHVELMVQRVGSLAHFGNWDFVRVALQWDRYSGPMSVVLHPEKFRRALMSMFRDETVRDHVQEMMDRARDRDDDEA